MEKKKIAEAALFMSPEPLSVHDLAKIMELPLTNALKELEELVKQFNTRNSSLEIIKSGINYRMIVRPDYLSKVRHLATETDLSKAVLRTLGLISVKQPVKQSIIARIIGNKAYDYVKELEEKGFLKTRKHANTKIIETTKKFESYFGERIESLTKMI